MATKKRPYHHGNLAESLLNAVDEIAVQFGLEAVTLRACAKRVGVSPSSAFRHYVDKRALLTAFAARAIDQLCAVLETAEATARKNDNDALMAVCLAYIEFALQKPAYFRAMWREEAIYASDESYVEAAQRLQRHLRGGFADTIQDDDPDALSAQELLAWSSVHGLANLFIDGPLWKEHSIASKLDAAREMIAQLRLSLEA